MHSLTIRSTLECKAVFSELKHQRCRGHLTLTFSAYPNSLVIVIPVSDNHTVTAKAEPLTHTVGEAMWEAVDKAGYWENWTKVPTKVPENGLSLGDILVLMDTRQELIITLGNLGTDAQRGARNKTVRDKVSRRITAITNLLDKNDALAKRK